MVVSGVWLFIFAGIGAAFSLISLAEKLIQRTRGTIPLTDPYGPVPTSAPSQSVATAMTDDEPESDRMGMVTKKLRQRGREEFTAPRPFTASHDPASASASASAIDQQIQTMNDAKDASHTQPKGWLDPKVSPRNYGLYHFYAKPEGQQRLLLSYGRTVDHIAGTAARQTGRFWLAAFDYDGPAADQPGQHSYRAAMLRWTIKDDGEIINGPLYDTLISHIYGALGCAE